MKRTAGVAVILLLLALCACGREDASELRLGYLQSDLHHLPAFVALEKGFFKEQGLKVRVSGVFKAGPEEMSAFGAGALDFGYVGQAPATAAIVNGIADVQFIAQVNLEGSAIVVRKDDPVTQVRQLAGRSVAIPGHATMQDFLLRRALQDSGLTFNSVRAIVLKPPEMQQALEQKSIDAFIAWQPYPAQALNTGSARILIDSSRIWQDHPCCVLVAKRSLCVGRPDIIRKIRAAHQKACDFIAAHPREAVTIGVRYTPMKRPVVAEALSRIRYTSALDQKRSRQFVDFLKAQNYIKHAAEADRRFSQAFFGP